VGRLSEEDGSGNALILGVGELFAEHFFDLLDAGLRVNDAPNLAGFERSDINQNVNHVQVGRRIDELAGDFYGGQGLGREIDGNNDALLAEVRHGKAVFK